MTRTILLLARAAIAGEALREMESLTQTVSESLDGARVEYAFTEQGQPSLRAQLTALADYDTLLLVPLMLPSEPGYRNSITRMVERWRLQHRGPVPKIIMTSGPAAGDALVGLILPLLAQEGLELAPMQRPLPDASLIPDAQRRVLVCMGSNCSDAGAAGVWQHLRTRQERDRLRHANGGMMSCRTSCLGACNLGPVLQVWPDGTHYCGVSEDTLDRIIDSHILSGIPVEDLAYLPTGKKQRLR